MNLFRACFVFAIAILLLPSLAFAGDTTGAQVTTTGQANGLGGVITTFGNGTVQTVTTGASNVGGFARNIVGWFGSALTVQSGVNGAPQQSADAPAHTVVVGPGVIAPNAPTNTGSPIINGANSVANHTAGAFAQGLATFFTHPAATTVHVTAVVAHGIVNLFQHIGAALTGHSTTGTDAQTSGSATTQTTTNTNADTNPGSSGTARPSPGSSNRTGTTGNTVTPSHYQQTGVGPLSGSESTKGKDGCNHGQCAGDPIDTGGAGNPNNGAGVNNAGNHPE